ncbi:MAG: hypothetical protein JKY02_06230 [Flavobacteriaceae bacterium]|nr:hypothetical protein [Flavobacteriaceae bacterium]
MSNNSNISTSNSEQQSSFDVKYYIFKIFGYWQLFLVTIIIALIVARFMNGYRQKRFSLNTMISVKEENNPLFSTGTNLTFNWGGASDVIETVKVMLNSRSHNEKVVSELQFYVDYLQEGKYRKEDVYGKTPFRIKVDTTGYQLYGKLIKIETIENNQFKLSVDFNESGENQLIRYSDNDLSQNIERQN